MTGLRNTNELEQLLRQAGLLTGTAGEPVPFTGVSNNSAETEAGDLFICKGFGFKPAYLHMAEDKGAAVYLAETPIEGAVIPFVQVSDVRKAQSLIARAFYQNPSESFTLIGITGTKGKTTTAYDMKAILDDCSGVPTGLLSTVERFVGEEHEPSHLTTPESLDLQRLLATARDHEMPYVTMEVSSQAYKMERVAGEYFDFGLFLNFGEDHICAHEHPDLEDYFACKLRLMKSCRTAVICRETDRFEQVYAAALSHAEQVVTVGMEREDCDYAAVEIQKTDRGFRFRVREKDGSLSCIYSLLQEGRFNVENALAAIAVGRELCFTHENMAAALAGLTVPGRMNLMEGDGVRVLVDYAHNRLSFEALFSSLQQDYPNAELISVAGAPGERDPARVTDIGSLCGKYADVAYFTSDDPGFEDPLDLCTRMASAARSAGNAEIHIVTDRAQAVEMAVRQAPRGSVVVLAGKGHEVTQRIRGRYEPYESDAAVARRVLDERIGAQK